ncbi:butyrophilin subfamily 1 member A1-like isoform X1 [Tachysurus ichikawai]
MASYVEEQHKQWDKHLTEFRFALNSAVHESTATTPAEVIGPEAPLVAVAGEDLVLPCFIKPITSAVDMTVEWFKLDVKDSLVHLYRDCEDKNEDQVQSYRGRTSLFKEELQKGNTSLKLSELRVSDEGEYKCLVEDKSWYNDITVNIIVEGLQSLSVEYGNYT